MSNTITTVEEFETALNWLHQYTETTPTPKLSEAVLAYWTQTPSNFVYQESVWEVLTANGVHPPEGVDVDEPALKESFLEFAGFDKFRTPKSFFWAGNGDPVYLCSVRGNAKEEMEKWLSEAIDGATNH